MELVQRLEPGRKVHLAKIDPNFTAGLEKAAGKERLVELGQELNELQDLLYAAGTHSVLIVLQGMDTSGKDGTIRSVLSYVDPQGCQIEAFKTPTPDELSHDFLWRVHQGTPGRGMITVFNRSHYEDVLIVRVRELVPREVWSKRYTHINHFEELLSDNNTIILKFFLHISKEEQEQRLLDREQELEKAWKLAVSDWEERRFWDDYQHAYEDVLQLCNTKTAPWYIVPANKKWFRNLAVAMVLVKALRDYKQQWLDVLATQSKQRIEELHRYRGAQ
jgi:PPK2 family polyphosphate:nucleotide phosphotransferase